VPSWAKDPAIGYKMINARAETAHEKPAFRYAWKRRRCLILADGFYEWRTENGAKQPYRIAFNDNRPFVFAGLYEYWSGPDGSELTTCSILTTDASSFLAPVHHRMPVILPAAQHRPWLDPLAEFDGDILPPFEDPDLIYFPVSRDLNKPANDHPGLLEEVTLETPVEPEPSRQGSLF
jgi:putative SOS response-associated peptidase YedK